MKFCHNTAVDSPWNISQKQHNMISSFRKKNSWLRELVMMMSFLNFDEWTNEVKSFLSSTLPEELDLYLNPIHRCFLLSSFRSYVLFVDFFWLILFPSQVLVPHYLTLVASVLTAVTSTFHPYCWFTVSVLVFASFLSASAPLPSSSWTRWMQPWTTLTLAR